jgi:hypothetical protein
MAVAQGIRKITVMKRQVGLGTPASGSGGQIMRRRTSVFQAPRDTFESDEIVSHHQATGIAYGLKHATGRLEGLMSPGTYSQWMESMLEKNFVSGVTVAGASITIAGTGPTWTVTRAAGSFLTDGFKIGDVVRLSVGALNAANINKNLWVQGVTALVLTVRTLNLSNLVAEGPIATTTVTAFGKKSIVPLTAHTDHYYTVEEWFADLARSEMFQDMRVGNIAVGIPATGNATLGFDLVGLKRTPSGSQVLTTPAAETTTPILSSVNGVLLVNGVLQSVVTALNFTIANGAADMGAVVGTNLSPDVQKGRVRVSGQFTALFDSASLQTLYDSETAIALHSVVAASADAAASFLRYSLGKIKLTGDTPDDGEKGIVRTYPFTAEINGAGGAALADDQTIISIQDSDVP